MRTRVRHRLIDGGAMDRNTGSPTPPPYVSWGLVLAERSKCVDIPGASDNQGLLVEHTTKEGGTINKPYPGPFGSYFTNYQCDYLRFGGGAYGHLGTEAPSNDVAAAIGAASANPSRSYVDLPVAIAELREVPELIRSAGNSILKQAASANIKYEFGIKPLASDLAKLLQFKSVFDKRMNELKRMQARGLRRTHTIGNWSANARENVIVQSSGAFIIVPITTVTTEQIRVHTRWSPQGSFKSLSDQRMRALATKAMLGLTVDLSTAWELIPWSWLVDWCSTIGTYLQATRNIVPCELTELSVMRHKRTESNSPEWSYEDCYMSPIRSSYETKTRVIWSVIPTAHFPVLDARKLGIVASLGVLKRR